MKTNLSFLAIALLAVSACSSPTSENVSNEAANATLAKSVIGRSLVTDAAYDKPCHFLGEELVRETFAVGETELTEHDLANGCAFEWGGNRVALTFAGPRPFASMYKAEYLFDTQFRTAAAVIETPVADEDTVMAEASPEGAEPAEPVAEHTAMPGSHHAVPAVALTGAGSYEPIAGLGDKAVWNGATGMLHVLYSNHIINVQVSGKDKAAVREEKAKELAELVLEKVMHGEATL